MNGKITQELGDDPMSIMITCDAHRIPISTSRTICRLHARLQGDNETVFFGD